MKLSISTWEKDLGRRARLKKNYRELGSEL
jgi:hypothetical protein